LPALLRRQRAGMSFTTTTTTTTKQHESMFNDNGRFNEWTHHNIMVIQVLC
jgi:hypothetical protein